LSKTSSALGSATWPISDTGRRCNPTGSSKRIAVPKRHATSSAIAMPLARRRRQRTPMASMHVPRASSSVATTSPAMWISPARTNGAADRPAINQKRLCSRSRTNAASGRPEGASALINSLDHLLVDVDGKRSTWVVDDPHVQHRRSGDVDRTQWTRRRRRHEAELEAEWREADVLVLMPRGQGTAGVRPEIADVLHLEHRPEQDGTVFRVRVDETLWMFGVHHIGRVDVALVHPVGRRQALRTTRPKSRIPRLVPIAIGCDRDDGLAVSLLRRGLLPGCGDVVGLLQARTHVAALCIRT